MLRILFVTGSLVHGGAERHSITVMNRLAARGHECHAVYVKNDPSQLDRIQLRGQGSVRCLEARRFFDWQALKAFAAHLERVQPSVIVAANAYALIYASLARYLARLPVPLLVTYHSTLLLGLKERIKMLIERHFFRAADCLVFVCTRQMEYWQRRHVSARRNEVIHNGVDAGYYSAAGFVEAAGELRRQHAIAPNDYLIGMVAVLRPEKNHTQLLEAVLRLRRLGIPAKALLIGDGEMRPAIEALARAFEIEQHVIISGFQGDVRPFIAACDTIALCSTTEALSLAALEAMAMGRPVVHSAVGGAAELITPGHDGYLFPVGDTDALVQCLALLADRAQAEQMGRHARDTASQEFSEDAMLDRYESTLLNLCQPRSDPRSTAIRQAQQFGWRPAINDRQARSNHHEYL